MKSACGASRGGSAPRRDDRLELPKVISQFVFGETKEKFAAGGTVELHDPFDEFSLRHGVVRTVRPAPVEIPEAGERVAGSADDRSLLASRERRIWVTAIGGRTLVSSRREERL